MERSNGVCFAADIRQTCRWSTARSSEAADELAAIPLGLYELQRDVEMRSVAKVCTKKCSGPEDNSGFGFRAFLIGLSRPIAKRIRPLKAQFCF